MTATYSDTKNHAWLIDQGSFALKKLSTAINRQWTSLTAWLVDLNRYHEASFDLRSLDDRELDDIGIPRWQIPEIALRSVVERRAAEQH